MPLKIVLSCRGQSLNRELPPYLAAPCSFKARSSHPENCENEQRKYGMAFSRGKRKGKRMMSVSQGYICMRNKIKASRPECWKGSACEYVPHH
ncbi:hypothetical protein HZ326_6222 [Fusarium oxysporum f. sp. albedinis]|nr:hypothetical protein HZ326_6222 [Fusarium oxysporum f. sp. albedinis]